MKSARTRSTKVCAALICVLGSVTYATSTERYAIQAANDAAALNAMGMDLFKEGKYEEAIKSFKAALKLKKDFPEAQLNLGDAYLELGDNKKAIESYKQALQYRPSAVTIYNKIGIAYKQLGDNKKAIEAFTEAIHLDSKAGLGYFNLGALYASRDRKKEALEQYQILKTLDPALAKKLYTLIYRPVATVFAPDGVHLALMAVDEQGNLVNSLSKDDVQVSDEDAPQTVTSFSNGPVPIVYGIAIDTSGSMRPGFQNELDLAKAIIESSQSEDEIFVEAFVDSNKIETIQEFTTDKNKLYRGLETFFIEGGQSAIIDAVYLAAQHVAEHKMDSAGYLRRVLVLITDGDERVSYYTVENLVNVLRQLDVQIFTICISKETEGSSLNKTLTRNAKPLLMTLAKETGGWAFFPTKVSELAAVAAQLTAMIRTQYLLTYKPNAPGGVGTYHRVNVALTNPANREKIKVKTRSGYVVPDTQPMPPP